MKVVSNLSRTDLLRLNLSAIPRTRMTYVNILLFSSIVFIFLFWKDGVPDNTTGWLKYIIVSLGGGLGGMVGDSIFSIIRVLISANIKSGILGEHYYELLEDGILEKTQVNEGISKWEGVLEIVERGDYLIIKVSSYHFHVIPKRSFPDESEYKSFKHMACSLWQKAQKCVEDNKSIDI